MEREASAPKSAPAPVPDVTYKYTFFGSKGAGDGQFDAPMGMAFNRDKTEIFVADSSNNRVQVLNYDRETGDLKFSRTISAKLKKNDDSDGDLNNPTGVALLLSDKHETKPVILVADTNNSKVCGFKYSDPIVFLGEFNVDRPCSVAVDKDGAIFAYDSRHCRIAKYNDDAREYICEKGTGNGELGHWGTLAFDKDDHLVVADAVNNRVQVLNRSNGEHIRTITGIIDGKRSDQLNHPCGIAFTEDYKHIIIADFENNRVCVLTYADGKIVKSFGTKDSGLGKFNGPYGVLVDDKYGRIIVSEEYNHRIQVIHNAFPKKPAKVDNDPDTKLSKLRTAIDDEINAFIVFLKKGEHIEILKGLIKAIQKDRDDRKKTDDDALRNRTERQKKKGKLSKSQQLPKTKVTEFINAHPDDIFVVTGGSFNPPHNGHIGMFQKAYEALIKNSKITMDDGKKVYGVMAPATDDWIENKLCKEVTPATKRRAAGVSSDCTDAERATPLSKAAIELKRIQLANRVNLCKLSCDSYAWPESDKFNASNMIVVNETAEGEEFTKNPNTYYLCGSDYYKDSDTKFICVLRKGDTREDAKKTLVRIKDGKTERVPIKDADIIIENDGKDNDASSTMLRNILTEISKVKIEDGLVVPALPTKEKLLSLISIPVLRRLLNVKYILTEPEKNKKTLELMNIDLNAPDANSSNDTDSKLTGKHGVTTGGRRSLCNIGSMCYMNAALQLIYSMDEFKKSVLSMSSNPLKDYLDAISKGVDASSAKRLATALHVFSKITDKTKRPFNSQEDSSELLLLLLENTIFNSAKALVNFTTIESVHTTTTTDTNKAECRKETGVAAHPQYAAMPNNIKDNIIFIPNTPTQPQVIFNLPVTGSDSDFNKMNLEKIIPMDAKSVTVTDFLKPGKACSTINKNTISTQTVIIPDPKQQYLIIVLMRYRSDGSKITTPINLNDARITLGAFRFGIKGCISHHGGSPNGGHYTYVAFEGGKPKMVYDDSNIVDYATYLNTVDRTRTVDTEGYVLLFEREEPK